MELSNRKALLDRAKYLMDKYSFNAFEAIKMAEQELEEVEKEGEIESGN